VYITIDSKIGERERGRKHTSVLKREREKERQQERQREISKDEYGCDDDEEDTRKRRRRSSMLEEKRRKRQQEKEEDLADRLKEEEEIAEAKKRAIEEEKRIAETKSLFNPVAVSETAAAMQVDGMVIEGKEAGIVQQTSDGISGGGNDIGKSFRL